MDSLSDSHEKPHASRSVAPSFGGAATGAAAAGAGYAAYSTASDSIQERSTYAYGQGATPEDDQSDTVNGVYSAQPQVQTPYNAEAYGSYAAYEDAGAAQGDYQDAQRAYQGQQGYDQTQQGYDQGAYQQYDQQYAEYQQHYATYDAQAYPSGYDQQQYGTYDQQAGQYDQQQQAQYTAPHPYSSPAVTSSAQAYGH